MIAQGAQSTREQIQDATDLRVATSAEMPAMQCAGVGLERLVGSSKQTPMHVSRETTTSPAEQKPFSQECPKPKTRRLEMMG
jgi:hypothetical protein